MDRWKCVIVWILCGCFCKDVVGLKDLCFPVVWSSRPRMEDILKGRSYYPCFCTLHCGGISYRDSLESCGENLEYIVQPSISGAVICPSCPSNSGSRKCSVNAPCYETEFCIRNKLLSSFGLFRDGVCVPREKAQRVCLSSNVINLGFISLNLNVVECIPGAPKISRPTTIKYEDFANYCGWAQNGGSKCDVHSLSQVRNNGRYICVADGIPCEKNPCCAYDRSSDRYSCGGFQRITSNILSNFGNMFRGYG